MSNITTTKNLLSTINNSNNNINSSNSSNSSNSNKLVITLQHNPIDLIQQQQTIVNEEPIKDVSQLVVVTSPITSQISSPITIQPIIVTQQQEETTQADCIINNPKKIREDDENRISARQKQIDIGKNTIGYQNFIIQLKYLNPKHIVKQPNIFQICSKRSFDGQCKIWRRYLHQFDTQYKSTETNNNDNNIIIY